MRANEKTACRQELEPIANDFSVTFRVGELGQKSQSDLTLRTEAVEGPAL